MRQICTALIALLLVAPALAGEPAVGGGVKKKGPDCYCTNRGVRYELGQFACLRVDGRKYLARCEMSLNNPMWREKEPSCPTS